MLLLVLVFGSALAQGLELELIVTLGFRLVPALVLVQGLALESVLVQDADSGSAGVGLVNVVEFLGDENRISLTLQDKTPITAITSPKVRPAIGDRMGIFLQPDSIFIFDAEQGGRLRP